MGLPFHKDALLTEERELWIADGPVVLDRTRYLVPPHELKQLDRFVWEIIYRHGGRRRRYERIGETLFQTYFSRIPHAGIERFRVFDARRPRLTNPVLEVYDIPPEAELDFLVTNGVDQRAGAKIARIYTYGWHVPGTQRREYWHINGAFDPPKWFRDKNRNVSPPA